MARTIRRRAAWRDIDFALAYYRREGDVLVRFKFFPESRADRRLLAGFHSDSGSDQHRSSPRWFSRLDSRRIKSRNKTVLCCWLRLQDFDPVFQYAHMHSSDWGWQ